MYRKQERLLIKLTFIVAFIMGLSLVRTIITG